MLVANIKIEKPLKHQRRLGLEYSAFACSGSCPVPGHVILTCKLHISGKI